MTMLGWIALFAVLAVMVGAEGIVTLVQWVMDVTNEDGVEL